MSGKSAITKVIGVRVENEIKAIIEADAQRNGISPSELLREVISREFKGRKPVDKSQASMF